MATSKKKPASPATERPAKTTRTTKTTKTTKTAAPAAPATERRLPAWAGKNLPAADGTLAIPKAFGASLRTALGPLDREHGIVHSAGMSAVERGGAWGLARQLVIAPGAGRGVARVLDVLAAHALPIVHLDLSCEPGIDVAAELGAALAPEALARVVDLEIGVRGPLDAASTEVLGAAIARMPVLEALTLRAKGGEGVAEAVTRAKSLRALTLVSTGTTGAELTALASSPTLARLERITLGHVDADDAAIGTLFAAPFARGLRAVTLTRREKLPADYPGLGALPSLSELDLGFVSAAGLRAIADAPFAPGLVRLALHGTAVDDATAERLAARGLPQLETLHVKWAEISADGIDALVRAAPRLRLLELPASVKARKTWTARGRQIL